MLAAAFLAKEGFAYAGMELPGREPWFVFGVDRMHLNVQIDPIQKGIGETRTVAGDFGVGATAGGRRAKKVPAGAGVHRRDEQKIGIVCDFCIDPGYADMAIFEGLSQRFEHRFRKMGEFVEKQDTPVRQTHFPDLGFVCPADISINKCYLFQKNTRRIANETSSLYN